MAAIVGLHFRQAAWPWVFADFPSDICLTLIKNVDVLFVYSLLSPTGLLL